MAIWKLDLAECHADSVAWAAPHSRMARSLQVHSNLRSRLVRKNNKTQVAGAPRRLVQTRFPPPRQNQSPPKQRPIRIPIRIPNQRRPVARVRGANAYESRGGNCFQRMS
jgi:hypothetical protein